MLTLLFTFMCLIKYKYNQKIFSISESIIYFSNVFFHCSGKHRASCRAASGYVLFFQNYCLFTHQATEHSVVVIIFAQVVPVRPSQIYQNQAKTLCWPRLWDGRWIIDDSSRLVCFNPRGRGSLFQTWCL